MRSYLSADKQVSECNMQLIIIRYTCTHFSSTADRNVSQWKPTMRSMEAMIIDGTVTVLKRTDWTGPAGLTFTLIRILSRNNDN